MPSNGPAPAPEAPTTAELAASFPRLIPVLDQIKDLRPDLLDGVLGRIYQRIEFIQAEANDQSAQIASLQQQLREKDSQLQQQLATKEEELANLRKSMEYEHAMSLVSLKLEHSEKLRTARDSIEVQLEKERENTKALATITSSQSATESGLRTILTKLSQPQTTTEPRLDNILEEFA